MDWTGGVGRRYAMDKDDSERRRQREYFARARARHTVRSSQRQPSKWTPSHEPPLQTSVKFSHDAGKVPSSRSTTNPPQPAIPSKARLILSPKAVNEHDHLRHELLSRPDWLGLSINQPLHRKKSSSRSSDRLDQRCGIRKTIRKPRRPPQPALSPVPEGLPLFNHGAAGTFPDTESIRINVGTDALASQTQQSRTPGTAYRLNTSMRAPSTFIERFSEVTSLHNPEVERSVIVQPDTVAEDLGAFPKDTNVEVPPTVDHSQDFLELEVKPSHHSTDERLQETAASPQQSEASNVDILALTYNSLNHSDPSQLFDDFEQHMRDYKRILDAETAADRRAGAAVHKPSEAHTSTMPTTEKLSPEDHPDDLFSEDDGAVELVERAGEDEKTWRRLQNVHEFTSSHNSMDVSSVQSPGEHVMTPRDPEALILWPDSDKARPSIVSTPRGAGTQTFFLPTNVNNNGRQGDGFATGTTSICDFPGRKADTLPLALNMHAPPKYSSYSLSPFVSTPKGAGTQMSLLPTQASDRGMARVLDPLVNSQRPLRLQPTMTDFKSATLPRQKPKATEPLWRQFVLNTDEIDCAPDLADETTYRVYHMPCREDLWLSSTSAPLETLDRPGLSDHATVGQPTVRYEPSIPYDTCDGENGIDENEERPVDGTLMYDELVDNMVEETDAASWPDDSDDEIVDLKEVFGSDGTHSVRTSSILEYSRLLKRSPRKTRRGMGEGRFKRHQRFIEKRGK